MPKDYGGDTPFDQLWIVRLLADVAPTLRQRVKVPFFKTPWPLARHASAAMRSAAAKPGVTA
ncbi:hypothetical protein [Tranquillimonas rosea]|uniref:hypothetical protein n=1 Tax=Tranquillimonas rosea TaxID=641238 RepID=UPI003BABBFE4